MIAQETQKLDILELQTEANCRILFTFAIMLNCIMGSHYSN